MRSNMDEQSARESNNNKEEAESKEAAGTDLKKYQSIPFPIDRVRVPRALVA